MKRWLVLVVIMNLMVATAVVIPSPIHAQTSTQTVYDGDRGYPASNQLYLSLLLDARTPTTCSSSYFTDAYANRIQSP